MGRCSSKDQIFAACSTTLTTLRVLLHPLDKFFFGYHDSIAYFEDREVRFVHQLICTGWGDAQHLCHHCRVEEQWQIIIAFVLR